jgi:hypothetical protein
MKLKEIKDAKIKLELLDVFAVDEEKKEIYVAIRDSDLTPNGSLVLKGSLTGYSLENISNVVSVGPFSVDNPCIRGLDWKHYDPEFNDYQPLIKRIFS